jgi:preprotein translocase subunit YajC
MNFNGLNALLAQATTTAPATTPAGTPGTTGTPPTAMQQIFGNPLILIVLMVVMMYFLMIRPQSQQRKRQAQLLAGLKSGDKVVTASGIVGIVISVKDRTVSLRSADAKMEMTKSSVVEILERGGDEKSAS